MGTVCETCGVVGYKHLLLSCDDCKYAVHQYCLAEVLFDGSSIERWFCDKCLRRRGKVTSEGSLHKASNHADSGSAVRQTSTTSVESTKEARPYRNHKNKSKRSKTKSCREKKSSSRTSLLRMHAQDRSDMRPVGNKANRRDCTAPNISCASEKALHSCEIITMEVSKADKDENQQVDKEHSVRTINDDSGANRFPASINKSNPQKPLEEPEHPPGVAERLNPPKDSNYMSAGNIEIEYPKGCRMIPVLEGENQNEPSTLLDRADSSSLSETTSKQNVLLEATDTAVVTSDTAQNCVKDNPRKRRQRILLDDDDDGEEAANAQSQDFSHRADSSSLSETTLKHIVLLEASDTAVELSGTVEKCVKENPSKRRQLILLDDEEEAANVQSEDFNHRADSSSLAETALKQNVLLEASDTAVKLSGTVQNCVKENPRKRRQLILLDDNDDKEVAADAQSEDFNHWVESLSETTLKQNVLLEASDTAVVGLSGTVQNCLEDNPRKRRQIILLDDDDGGEEAADVQSEDFNHRSLECGGSLSKHRIDTEDSTEETVHTGELNGQNLSALQLDILIPESSEITQPVKKRKSCYTPANEDDEDGEVIIGTSNALNDVSKLTSETLVANEHGLQSRINFDSESANQKRCMFSQPIDEPIWSGILKINSGVFISLVAHMSSKACGRVWELATSLQPVVEVIKLPQLEAWPKSWKASGPTDGDIALYFFPASMSPNEESDVLVEEIIDSGAAIKAVVGVAELLIFPSTILPEQYHVRQDKHYLWGVFKRMEDESGTDVLVQEQDASAHAEEGEIQEHHFMDQQHGVQCESPDHVSSAVKHVVHVENQLLADPNSEAQEGMMKSAMGEALASPANNSSSIKLNPLEDGSNCFMQPRSDPELHVPEEVDRQEDEQNFTRPSADLGPVATTAKSIDSAERGEVPPPTQLFGLVAARTPRAQQLIQEMVSEGALLFSVAEETMAFGSTVGSDSGAQVHPPMQERCQSIGFVPLDDDVASDACLELFPVRQEHIGWTPSVEAAKEVDLDLSLSARSGAPLGSFL